MMGTKVIWFTGLSGAGKSTLAEALKKALEEKGRSVLIVDGDDVRDTLHRHLGFTAEDIIENNRLITKLVMKQVGQVEYILVPIISPFRTSRAYAREVLGDGFVELYVQSTEQVRVARDPKGLYKRAHTGELTDLIGHGGVAYEEPKHPEFIVCTDMQPLDESVAEVMRFLTSTEERQ